MLLRLVLIGIVTMYSATEHMGNPLRCGNIGGTSGVYDTSHAWVAVDIDHTDWQCGDLATICAAGECHTLPVMDSGPLSLYCVQDGDECHPILVDVPAHVVWWDGLSVEARVVNTTRIRERWER